MTIEAGDSVVAIDAHGVEHAAFATSRVEGKAEGHTFPVIWVSFEPGGQSIPWPVEFVKEADA